MHLRQRFFQSSKHFSNSIFGIAFSSFSDALLMSSMAVKRRPFKVLLIFGNRKKSHGAMSGEYVGWGIVTVLFLAKNSQQDEVWAGALSWCKSHELFFHKSRRFFRIASRKRRWTCRQYSLLTVWPHGKNSWCTMPLKSKNSCWCARVSGAFVIFNVFTAILETLVLLINSCFTHSRLTIGLF